MLISNWLERLTTRRQSRRRADCRNPHSRHLSPSSPARAPERLEDRTLLAGVTLITHGFQGGTGYPDWLESMGDAIAERISTNAGERFEASDVARYRIEIGDLPSLADSIKKYTDGVSANDAETGEIIATVDWSDRSNHLLPLALYSPTVASRISEILLNSHPAEEITRPLAELPVHLIGHSRGASVMAALAQDLGQQGIWVDQLTLLDTHPVFGDYGYEFSGTDVMPFENVVFADSYWRADVGVNPADFDGAEVNGAFNRQLNEGASTSPLVSTSEGVLDQAGGRDALKIDPSDPGYTLEHSDVHLWYHGTVDTQGLIRHSDFVNNPFTPPDAWYAGEMGPRAELGYNFSRIVGGNRREGEARSGVHHRLDGDGDRATLDTTDATWPNIIDLKLGSDSRQFGPGDDIYVTYYVDDSDSPVKVSFGFDDDLNPYNGRNIVDSKNYDTNPNVSPDFFRLSAPAASSEPFYVFARIEDQNHFRYAYVQDAITVSDDLNRPPVLTGSSVSPSEGNESTQFEFRVPYFDADGDSPERKELHLSSASGSVIRNLQLVEGDGSNGVYSATTTLPTGVYQHFFLFSDGTSETATSVRTGPLVNVPERVAFSIDPEGWIDSSDHDRDGVLEAGEVGFLSVRLRNTSDDVVDRVIAFLSTTDSRAVVTDELNYYGRINPGETSFGEEGHSARFPVAGDNVPFELRLEYIVDGTTYVQKQTVHADVRPPGDYFDFSISSVVIDDSTDAHPRNNGDGVFQSGESIHLKPRLQFDSLLDGLGGALNADVRLTFAGSGFELQGGAEGYPDLGDGQSGFPENNGYFNIEAHKDFTGTAILDAVVEWEGGSQPFVIEDAFELTVQPAAWLSLPSGPGVFPTVAPSESAQHSIAVSNVGTSTLHVTGFETRDQSGTTVTDTTFDVTSFDLGPGASRDVVVSIATTGVADGTELYRDIRVVSDGRTTDPSEDEHFAIRGLVSTSIPVFQVPNSAGGSRPDVSDDWIVWEAVRSGHSDIFAYRVSTGEQRQITTHPADQIQARISGNLIVWEDTRNDPVEMVNVDLYGYDLSNPDLGVFVVAGTGVRESIVGVDGNLVAFSQAYDTLENSGASATVFNLVVYEYQGDGQFALEFSTGWRPGSRNTMGSPRDFDDGLLVYEQSSYVLDSNSGGPYWAKRDKSLQVIDFADGDTSPQTAFEIDGISIYDVIAGPHRFAYLRQDSAQGDTEQVFLWEDGVSAQITDAGPSELPLDHGGSTIALGDSLLVYDKQGRGGADRLLYYRNLAENRNTEFLVTNQVIRPFYARMDANSLVWKSFDDGFIYGAFLGQPDISISSIEFGAVNPAEGEVVSGSLQLSNLSDISFTGDITVRFFAGDPDAGGTQLGSDLVVTGGLVADSQAARQYSIPAPANSPRTSQEFHDIHARLYLTPQYDNPANNTAVGDLLVGPADLEGPTITDFIVTESQGDRDGLIGADEFVRVGWRIEDPSGISSAALFVDGFAAGPVYGLGSDAPIVADVFATVGPLGVGQHTIEVRATDNDRGSGGTPSHETISKSLNFTVVESEEVSILVDGQPVVDGGAVTIDFGVTVYGEQAVEKHFVIRNAGRQPLSVQSPNLPTGFATNVSSASDVTPGNTAVLRVTLPTDTVGVFAGEFSLVTTDGPRSPDGLDESTFTIPIRGEILPPDYPIVTSIVRATAGHSNASSVDFTVTFSENVSGVDEADFALTKTGEISGLAVTQVSGSGTAFVVSVNTGIGDGTIRLDVHDDDSILDVDQTPLGNAGADNGDYIRGETYVIDRTAPAVMSSVRVGANPSNSDLITFRVSFAEPVDGIDADDFVLTTSGTLSGAAVASISPADELSEVFTIVVDSGTGDGTLRLDVINDGSITDAAGNPLADAFAVGDQYSIDRTAPVVTTISRVGAATTNSQTASFAVSLSEPVLGVDTNDFRITSTGSIASALVQSVVGTGASYTVTVETGTGDGDLRLDVVDTDSIFDPAGNPLGGVGTGNGNFVTGESFDVFTPVTIRGTKWYDADGDAERDSGEPGLEGWTVYLDENNDGQWNGPEDEAHFALTNANGEYVIAGVRAGTYTVQEVLQPGWFQSFPERAGDKHTYLQTLVNGQAGADGLGGAKTVAVYGNSVYVTGRAPDENAVAVYTRDEIGRLTFLEVHRRSGSGLSGVTVSPGGNHVFVTGNDDHTIVVFDRSPSTGALTLNDVYENGSAGVEGLEHPESVAFSPSGTHVYVPNAPFPDPNAVGLVLFSRNPLTGKLEFERAYNDAEGVEQASSVVASPDGKHVYVASGQQNSVGLFRWNDAGNQLDFVRVYDNGDITGENPFDDVVSVAISPDGQHVFAVSKGTFAGSDALVVFSRNSESGELSFHKVYRNGLDDVRDMWTPTSVAVSPGGNHIYVTSQYDPTREGTGRLLVFRRSSSTGDLQLIDVYRNLPDEIDGLGRATSVTVSPDERNVYVAGGNDDTVAVFGRSVSVAPVHSVDLVSGQTVLNVDFGNTLLPHDFGDAPDSYSTRFVNDGARHLTGSGLRLGSLVDSDPDGQPGDTSDGDDLDAHGDDDDGVTIPAELFVGETTTVEIVASATGILNAWIDWNDDGNWADDGEQVFRNVDVGAGGNTLIIPVPLDATLTSRTYARFRFSSESNLSFDGPAANGEVEDYAIAIVQHQGRIAGRKWHDIDGDGLYEPDDGETALSGWTVFLDQNENGVLDSNEASVVTAIDNPATSENETGTYSFSHLPPATYIVSEVPITGWQQTAPLSGDGGLNFLEVHRDGVGSVDGLADAAAVTVSPDGKHIYVTADVDDSVAVFRRNPGDNSLTFVEINKDGVGDIDGMNGPRGLAVSPDGKHVYVASRNEHSLAVFNRNETTGQLAFVEFKQDGVGGVDGLGGAFSVAVSPDGAHVYVASDIDEALAVFSRNATTGSLTYVEMERDGVNGVDLLNGVRSVTVSPDGKHVYAASVDDDSIGVFSRNSSTGELTLVEFQRNGMNGVNGIDGAQSVTISPDGIHVYAAGRFDDAIAVFRRNATTGALAFVGSQKNGVEGVVGLDDPISVTTSADGHHVYVASRNSDAVTTFFRSSTTDALTFVEVQSDGVDSVVGLDEALSIAVNPDGSAVYVVSESDALAVFSRDAPSPGPQRVSVSRDEVVQGIDFGNQVVSGHDNLAPRNQVPPAQQVTNVTSVLFSTTSGNPISVIDPDAGGFDLSVTLSVDNGILYLPSSDNVTITDGANQSSSMTIRGAELAINAALDGLEYTLTAGHHGTDTITIVTNDLGNSGSGGSRTDSDTVQISVIDTLNPTVTVDVVDASLNDSDAVSNVTFEFSEAVTGFVAADVIVSGGVLSDFAGSGSSYTAVFTANDGIDVTGSLGVIAGSYTDVTGNAGGADSDTVVIATLNPTVTVNVVDASLNDSDAVSNVTFAFSEDVTDFTIADVSAVNGALSNFQMVDANSYTVTFTANDGIAATGSVSVGTGYTDAVGNTGTAGSDTVVIDTQNSTVTVNIVDESLSDGDSSSSVTFEFSEDVTGFTIADVSAVNGAVSNFQTVDANSYTATFTANDGIEDDGRVTVTAASYADLAGNAGGAGDDEITIDTLNPTLTVNVLDASLSDGDRVSNVTFTFNENVGGFVADDVSVSGGVLSDFAGSGSSYMATFTANDGIETTGSMSVAAGSYTDVAGNAGGAGADDVGIDTLNPTLTVNVVDASLNDSDAVSNVTFEFSEAVTGFVAADVIVSGGVLSDFAGSGSSYTAVFTANDGIDVTGSLGVIAGSYTDVTGNAGGADSDTVVIDTLNPTVTVNVVDASLNDSDAVSDVTFEFSEDVTAFTIDDVSAVNGEVSNFQTVDARSYTVSFTASDGIAATGSVSVGTDYTDAVGNAGGADSDTVVIDTLNPTLTVDVVDAALNDSDAVSNVTFVFSEAVTGFVAADVIASGGVLSDFDGGGASYTAVFTANDGIEATGSLGVVAGSYTDLAANAGGAGTDTVAIDTLNPTVAVTPDGTVTTASPITFTFQFSETVSGFISEDVSITNGSAGTFTVVDGDTFTLDVTPAAGEAVMVSVAAGAAQDTAGNDNTPGTATVISLAPGEVTLPGGGSYEVLLAGPDLVVRLAGGTEQFRRSVISVSVLAITGSSSADIVTVLDSGGVVSTPISFVGSSGNDRFDASLATGAVTLIGSSRDDTLNGGSGNDLIIAGGGRDFVTGGAGNDFIAGRRGNDSLIGDGGDDTIFGGPGRDTIEGGSDSDELRGGGGPDTIRGGDGDDRILGGRSRDILDGDDGTDTLVGGGGRDNLAGGLGDDMLNGVSRDDNFNDLIGRDTLIGGIRPAARPAPVSSEDNPASEEEPLLLDRPLAYTKSAEEIDEAFAELLLPELLEL